MSDLAPPFFTGTTLSTEDPTTITAGTAVASFTAAQQNAKARLWSLTVAASPANLPANLYRGYVCIDNSASTVACALVQNGTTIRNIAAGAQLELWRKMGEVGTEAFSVVMSNTTVPPCLVEERSYL